MSTVKAITITDDSLLPRPKLDCDGGYDVAMKGPSVVVCSRPLQRRSQWDAGLGTAAMRDLVVVDVDTKA